MNFSFDYLISPITRERFFQEYFEKKHLHIQSTDPKRFDHLLKEECLDEILESQKLTLPNTRMAHYNGDLDANELSLEGTNIIDVSKVIEKFSQGATLILSQLQDRKESLKLFCDELSKDFGQRLQTNIYCTPGNSSQGFAIHHDTHDVFILQISGSKKWKIYESPIELAIKDQTFKKEEHEPGDIMDEFTMQPGDVLYIPRGLMHAAQTTDKKSIHITTGLMGYTWQDLLVDQINLMAQNHKALRKGFSPNYWENPNTYTKNFELIKELLSTEDFLPNALINMHKKSANRFSRRIANPLKIAESIRTLQLDSTLFYKKGTQHITYNEQSLSITLFNKEIELPIDYKPVIQYIEQKDSFIVRDLPLLDDESKISFAQNMLELGFLTILFKNKDLQKNALIS